MVKSRVMCTRHEEEGSMREKKSSKTARTTQRWTRPSLSPYVVDDVAFTLSDIRLARVSPRTSDR